ncbi:fimbria/pilus periplasmic chaperone [Providencia huaxiensis]|uniref:Fimbria/pilus periplasmic chaperone n=1 Tax=Providencia rettgeri TaxID=587 RepID=A0A427HI47_PRORE|nr:MULTISPECIES: fimbria/pilus periplasmic chaperone [Providencia]ELR5219396.1 fimbria/pilus periplasmic chaperone [Providencia rettgeri]MBV2188197.1 fimbria/pilus periplasmic chaperone [Providencia rettgeri]HEC8323875.1 fimbria/pilus periplasmic chaperone [Providencia rettgeri]
MKSIKKYKLLTSILVLLSSVFFNQANAAVALGATRVIYDEGQKQVQLSVTNNDEKGVFLIQSWVENTNGQKDKQFVITPPLFTMNGKKENTLRIIDATNNQLPKDRESLFWLNVKAIPAMDKSKANENTLQLAIISRIKLYYRPSNLDLDPSKVPDELRFKITGNKLTIINPTPYFATVTDITVGATKLENVLVPPLDEIVTNMPSNAKGNITFRTINDYGALTPVASGIAK